MNSPNRRAVLVEFPDEVDAFLRKTESPEIAASRIVAISPAARVALQRRSVDHDTTLAYFDTESHRSVQMAREEMCHVIAAALAIPDGFLLRQTYQETVIFYSRLFLGHLMKTLEILHRFQEQNNVETWVAVRHPAQPSAKPYISLQERYTADLTRDFAAARGLDCAALDAAPAPPARSRPSIREMPWIEACLARLYLRFFRSQAARPSAVVSHLAYEMDELVRELGRRRPDVTWFWLDQETNDGAFLEIKKALIRMWRIAVRRQPGPFAVPLKIMDRLPPRAADEGRLLEQRLFEQLNERIASSPGVFRYRGVSVAPFLLRKLQTSIIPHQTSVYRAARSMDQVLRNLKPRFVLSQSSDDARGALGECCRQSGVPAVLISHGSNVPSDDPAARIEHDHISRRLMNSTYPIVALQSPWAARFADEMKLRAQRVQTGPLIWSRLTPESRAAASAWLRNRFPGFVAGRTRVILYVCAASQRQTTHFFIPETQDECIRSLNEVIHAARGVEDVVVVVRHRLQHLCSPDDLRELIPDTDRVAIHAEGRFSEALAMANLLVTFYSATVEEALNNRIPVLLYGGRGRYRHLPAALIESSGEVPRSAVYWVKDPGHLSAAIPRILNDHPVPVEPEMLKPYCFQPEDTTPFARIVDEFLNGHR